MQQSFIINRFSHNVNANEELQGQNNIKKQITDILLSNNADGFLEMMRTLNDNPHINSIPSENLRNYKLDFVKTYIIENSIKTIFFSLGSNNNPQISCSLLQAIIDSFYTTTQNLVTNVKSFLHTALMGVIKYKDTSPLMYLLDKTAQLNPSQFQYMGLDFCTILLKNSSTECLKVIIDFFVNKQPQAFQKMDYKDISDYNFVPIGSFIEVCVQICINLKLFERLEIILNCLSTSQIEGIINSQNVKISVADNFEALNDTKSEKVLQKVCQLFKDVCEDNNTLEDGMKNYALYYRYTSKV